MHLKRYLCTGLISYMMLGVVVIALGASIATVRKIRKSED